MKRSLFWKIIDHSRKKARGRNAWETTTRQSELLTRHLSKQDPKEIEDFERHFTGYLARAYTRDMWLAVYLMNGHCDFVIFDRLLGWLIMQGYRKYQRVLDNPDALAGFAERDIDTDDMLYIGYRAYKLATGAEIEQSVLRAHPGMTDSPDDMSDLAMQFPNLADKFWM